MYYIVTSKTGEAHAEGETYTLRLDSRTPIYQHSILGVTKEQFDAVRVGDKIEIALAPSVEFAQEVYDLTHTPAGEVTA